MGAAQCRPRRSPRDSERLLGQLASAQASSRRKMTRLCDISQVNLLLCVSFAVCIMTDEFTGYGYGAAAAKAQPRSYGDRILGVSGLSEVFNLNQLF